MAKLDSCRLLLDVAPGAGARNMAVDAALLESAVTDGLATFRWYRWAEPTLSLGYFQQTAEIAADPRLAGLPRVRRLTGGGAILHDQEWTYSLAVPARQSLCRHPDELYDLVHNTLGDMLRKTGCRVQRRGETTKLSPESVLCFSRRDAHDVLCGEHKVLGSAQRRRKGAILQHGTLLLRASRLTPEHPGLEDLCPSLSLQIEDLQQAPSQLAENVIAGRFTTRELERLPVLEQEIHFQQLSVWRQENHPLQGFSMR